MSDIHYRQVLTDLDARGGMSEQVLDELTKRLDREREKFLSADECQKLLTHVSSEAFKNQAKVGRKKKSDWTRAVMFFETVNQWYANEARSVSSLEAERSVPPPPPKRQGPPPLPSQLPPKDKIQELQKKEEIKEFVNKNYHDIHLYIRAIGFDDNTLERLSRLPKEELSKLHEEKWKYWMADRGWKKPSLEKTGEQIFEYLTDPAVLALMVEYIKLEDRKNRDELMKSQEKALQAKNMKKLEVEIYREALKIEKLGNNLAAIEQSNNIIEQLKSHALDQGIPLSEIENIEYDARERAKLEYQRESQREIERQKELSKPVTESDEKFWIEQYIKGEIDELNNKGIPLSVITRISEITMRASHQGKLDDMKKKLEERMPKKEIESLKSFNELLKKENLEKTEIIAYIRDHAQENFFMEHVKTVLKNNKKSQKFGSLESDIERLKNQHAILSEFNQFSHSKKQPPPLPVGYNIKKQLPPLPPPPKRR